MTSNRMSEYINFLNHNIPFTTYMFLHHIMSWYRQKTGDNLVASGASLEGWRPVTR
jgi:hypothetical protein